MTDKHPAKARSKRLAVIHAQHGIGKRRAVIDADHCTGCEACLEVCPVDCISLRTIELGIKGIQSWCQVDWQRCIGCGLCVRLPRRKTNPNELPVCPWDALEMVPSSQLPDGPGSAAD